MNLLWPIYVIVFIVFYQQKDPLEEILKKCYKTVNQEELNKVNSLEFKGTYSFYSADSLFKKNIPTMVGSYKLLIIKNQSVYERIQTNVMGLQEYIFNKDYAWERNNSKVSDMHIGKADSLLIPLKLDIEGHLYHWKEKGFKATYLGNKILDGIKFVCIELRIQGNNFLYYYLDQNSGLIKRIDFYREATQTSRPYHFIYSDFKTIDGIKFPYTITETSYLMGKCITVIHYKYISLNPKIDKSVFIEPAK